MFTVILAWIPDEYVSKFTDVSFVLSITSSTIAVTYEDTMIVLYLADVLVEPVSVSFFSSKSSEATVTLLFAAAAAIERIVNSSSSFFWISA